MVNVIIPTYKARDTLPKALDSLVAQTKKTFVVTIVQDGDGEDYSDIISEYRKRGLGIRILILDTRGDIIDVTHGSSIAALYEYLDLISLGNNHVVGEGGGRVGRDNLSVLAVVAGDDGP